MLLFWLCLFVLLSSIGSSFGAEQSKTTDPSEVLDYEFLPEHKVGWLIFFRLLVQNVQEKLTVMENTLTPRIFNTSSLFNYNASSISNYISNYLQFYYGNSAEWIKTPWFALVSGMIDTVVLVVLVGIFIVGNTQMFFFSFALLL